MKLRVSTLCTSFLPVVCEARYSHAALRKPGTEDVESGASVASMFPVEQPRRHRRVEIIDRTEDFGAESKEAPTEGKMDEATVKALRAAFESWSLKAETIGRAEVAKVLHKAGMAPSSKDVDSIIAGMDTNKNGSIEWDEWIAAHVRKSSRKKKAGAVDQVTQMQVELRRKRAPGHKR